jgi:uncharacterized protein YbaP (TraB family)
VPAAGAAWYDGVVRAHPSLLAALVALSGCARAPATAPMAAPRAAPPPPPAASATVDDDQTPGPFLWQVDGAAGPSYLFGTIHIGVDPTRELPALVWDKLEAAREIAIEADMTAADPTELDRLESLPAGESLEKLLGAADWKRLRAALSGLPIRTLRARAPWFAYSLVMQGLYPTPTPLDLALQARAVELGKQVTYLEDWRFQIGVVAEVLGLDDLRELLADPGKARARLDEAVRAYRAGDFRLISSLTLDSEDAKAHPDRFRRLFDERNRAWVDALEPRLRGGGLFVAVGVGHFAGPNGLLALLRGRGLTVRRVVR